MLHVVLGLILLIFVICNRDLARRALGVPSPRRPDPEPSPGSMVTPASVEPESCGEPLRSAAPIPRVSVDDSAFIPTFRPFKPERKNADWAEKKQQEEWEEFGSVRTRDTYPHGYGLDLDKRRSGFPFKEKFRSKAEVEWAAAFDLLGLVWEYEPLKFDMGPKYFSYTPDFRVSGLSVPDSTRDLYIEVKQFPNEEMNLSKYVRFTEWYRCDLVVLAHEGCDALKKRGDVLKARDKRYFLVLRCSQCNTYDWFPFTELPSDDYLRVRPGWTFGQQWLDIFPFGYRLDNDGQFWLSEEQPAPSTVCGSSNIHPAAVEAAVANMMPFKQHQVSCIQKALEKLVVPNYFVIEAGKSAGGATVAVRADV